MKFDTFIWLKCGEEKLITNIFFSDFHTRTTLTFDQANKKTFVIFTLTMELVGDRAFAVAAPRLWNSLPEELRSKSDINDFKHHLKAHFFTKAFSTP